MGLSLALLVLLPGCELVDAYAYLEVTLYPSPGVVAFQQVAHQGLPGGVTVNAAGGNLLLQRTDLSVDTLLGARTITGTFNSSDFRWHYNFDMAVTYDGTFVDGTGARYRAGQLAAGEHIPGTHWVKVSSNVFRTLGGLTHEFDFGTGRLSKVYWGTDDKIRLEYKLRYESFCEGVALAIDQCTDTQGCGDTPFVICTDNPGVYPTKARDRAGHQVIYQVSSDSSGTWLDSVDKQGRRRFTYDLLLNGQALPGNKTVFHANGMRQTDGAGTAVVYSFERMPGNGSGETYRRVTAVDYGGGSLYGIEYTFNTDTFISGVVAEYCSVQNCTTLDPALEGAAITAATSWLVGAVDGWKRTYFYDPDGEERRFYWNQHKRVREVHGWGANEDYDWHEDGPFENQLTRHISQSAGSRLFEWNYSGGEVGQPITVVEELNDVVQTTTVYEPNLNSFFSIDDPLSPLIREVRDSTGALLVKYTRSYGFYGAPAHPQNYGHGLRVETETGAGDTHSFRWGMLDSASQGNFVDLPHAKDRPWSLSVEYSNTAGAKPEWSHYGWHGHPLSVHSNKIQNFVCPPGDPPCGTISEDWVEFEYDAVGNLTKNVAPAVLTYARSVTTPKSGGVESWAYNEDRQLASISLSNSQCGSSSINFTYRADSQLEYISRPCGGDTSFHYDSRGRLQIQSGKADNAWRDEITYGYDDQFRPTSVALANGTAMITSYNDEYLVEQEIHSSSSDLTYVDYDYTNRRQLRSVSSGGFQETYGYDSMERIDSVAFDDGTTKTITYDHRNRVATTAYDDGGTQVFALSYTYDNDDRPLVTYYNFSPIYTDSYLYGKLEQTDFANGLTRTFGYDDTWQTNPARAPSHALASMETWQGAQQIEDSASSFVQLYNLPLPGIWTNDIAGFDSTSVLMDYDHSWRQEQDRRLQQYYAGGQVNHNHYFSFDALSNTTSMCSGGGCSPATSNHKTFTYNGETNRLNSFTDLISSVTTAYEYDSSGFVTKRAGNTLTYNGRGQLLTYGPSLSLTYDPMGRVVERVFGSETKSWCAGGEIECSSTGTWLKLDLGRAVLDLSPSQNHLYRHQDSRGNVLFATDQSGSVQTRYLYGAYGLLEQEGSSSDREARFAQGIDFGDIMIIGARVYDQAAGRFLSPDPVPNPINAFSYSLGNPLEVTDTSGREGRCVSGQFCGAAPGEGIGPGREGIVDEIVTFGYTGSAGRAADLKRTAEKIRKFFKNISFDGPAKGAWVGEGRIVGIRWKKSEWGARLDVHTYRDTGDRVLHINYGKYAAGVKPPEGVKPPHIELFRWRPR